MFSTCLYLVLMLKFRAANIAILSDILETRIPLSDMDSGFGDLQYMWSIRVAFLSDTLVGNVIIRRRYNSASVS